MNTFPGDLGMRLEQVQSLCEALWIRRDIGKIGNRRKREKAIGNLLPRCLARPAAFDMGLHSGPA